jgi:hypothetical protein
LSGSKTKQKRQKGTKYEKEEITQAKSQKEKKDYREAKKKEKRKKKEERKKKRVNSTKKLHVKRSFLFIFYVDAVCKPYSSRCSH